MSRVVDFNDGSSVDLGKVVYVGPVGGDPSWLRYDVWFMGGGSLEVYEERKGADMGRVLLTQMKREEFVKLWKAYLDGAMRR